MKPFFKFVASDQGDTLQIFDVIGLWGVQADDFAKRLAAIDGPSLVVEINSPGGDVFTGMTIYNLLKQSGKAIAVKVMGIAASAASVIAMAGDHIEMPSGTFMMIHNASTIDGGNAAQLRKAAELLDKIDDSAVALYARRTKLPESEIRTMLAAETWMEAEDAVRLGFATTLAGAVHAHATFDMKAAKLPPKVAAIFTSQREIEGLCAMAGRPHLAAKYLAAGKTIQQVRAALLPLVNGDADKRAAAATVPTNTIWTNRSQGRGK